MNTNQNNETSNTKQITYRQKRIQKFIDKYFPVKHYEILDSLQTKTSLTQK